jgi:hypothetical protein
MTNSPLGQYAPLVATVTSLGVIGAYVFAILFQHVLVLDAASMSQLSALALIAVGAVFGSAVSVNGWKQPLQAAHTRLDTLEKEVAVNTGNIGINADNIAANVGKDT